MRARQRLKSMMEQAKADALQEKEGQEFHSSNVFKALEPHLTLESFDGIHIYPGPVGGWHADLTLRGLPTGLPNVLGTPKAMPCSSREEAERMAGEMLATFVRLVTGRKHDKDSALAGNAAFSYDSVTLFIPLGLLAEIERVGGAPPEGYARKRLSEIRRELTDQPEIDGKVMESLSDEQVRRFQAVLALGLLSGISRWPETQDLPPPRKTAH